MFAFQQEGPVITQIKVVLSDDRHNSVKWPVFEQQQNMTGSNTSNKLKAAKYLFGACYQHRRRLCFLSH